MNCEYIECSGEILQSVVEADGRQFCCEACKEADAREKRILSGQLRFLPQDHAGAEPN